MKSMVIYFDACDLRASASMFSFKLCIYANRFIVILILKMLDDYFLGLYLSHIPSGQILIPNRLAKEILKLSSFSSLFLLFVNEYHP